FTLFFIRKYITTTEIYSLSLHDALPICNLPGAVPGSISIRGISTLQSQAPLVIVDGMEQTLTDIDPNQVKSITVLKDAASASLYGSRGANGVIIIETHRGEVGQFKVDLHTWTGIASQIDKPDFV